MIQIDVRGLRGRQIFMRIRDTFKLYCSRDMQAEILTEDPKSIPKIKAFVAMSGARSMVTEKDGYWSIQVDGDACACR